jgi:hypothetical protein
MNDQYFQVKTDGALSLSIQGERKGPWTLEFYLNFNGQPLYLIGNLCDTCQAMFRRIKYAHLPLTPQELSKQLDVGLSTISQDVINTVAALLPKGSYKIELITVKPSLIAGQKPPVYISCQADYYWLGYYEKTLKQLDFELVLPVVPRSEINGNRVAYYKAWYKSGREPTALSFSVYDYRLIRGEFGQVTLAHFLLDGHHKVMAASQMSRSISVLSFLWMDKRASLYQA